MTALADAIAALRPAFAGSLVLRSDPAYDVATRVPVGDTAFALRVKQQYDPDNVFRHNLNITPA
jgi:FAD/FMN-containing dehydrogenase